jgi:hypothetical protein
MSTLLRHPLVVSVLLCAVSSLAMADPGAPSAATVAAPAAATDVPQVLQLGTVSVSGEKVRAALRAIKQALKAPDSTDQAHRNDLVCRFVHEMDNPGTYLDCATNATNMQRRSSTQMARMAPTCSSTKCDKPADLTGMLDSLVSNQPGERLHMQVNPYQFKKMMAAAAATAVTAVPAATTAQAPAAANHSN